MHVASIRKLETKWLVREVWEEKFFSAESRGRTSDGGLGGEALEKCQRLLLL